MGNPTGNVNNIELSLAMHLVCDMDFNTSGKYMLCWNLLRFYRQQLDRVHQVQKVWESLIETMRIKL